MQIGYERWERDKVTKTRRKRENIKKCNVKKTISTVRKDKRSKRNIKDERR